MNRLRKLPRLLFCLLVSLLLIHLGGSARQKNEADEVKRLIDAYSRHSGGRAATADRKGKCGLADAGRLIALWPTLTEENRKLLRETIYSHQSQTERVIGKFHFYYDTTGTDAPALIDAGFNPIPGTAEQFVDSAGSFFNHAWHEEIDILGFAPPPLDSTGTYSIYIQSLNSGSSGGIYGQTIPYQPPYSSGPPALYKSFIEIDNTFSTAYTPSRGLPALRVTAAHEFNHAIQFGSYGYWGIDNQFYMEITSTWLETVVYPEVRDYYQYVNNSDPSVSSQFTHPEIRFTKLDGSIEYSRAVWGKYIGKRFSRDLMRRSWELIRQNPTLSAIDKALIEKGSSFREAFLEFAFWNLNAGPRCDTSRYYSDGLHYTPMALDSALYIPPATTTSSDVESYGSRYLSFCLLRTPSDSAGCGSGTNHMTVIVSNLDLGNAYSDVPLTFTYGLSRENGSGGVFLSNNLYRTLYVPDPANWNVQETVPSIVADPVVYPNPFRATGASFLWFRLPGNASAPTGHLTVFSTSYQQFYDGDLTFINIRPLEPALRWNGVGNGGTLISSGIYIYSLTVDNTTYTGKFAVVRQ